MFRFIAARRVRHVWEALDRRHRRPLLKRFARSFVYENVGAEHAFGGTFRTVEEIERHLDILFDLLPDVTFDVADVLVDGNPAVTRVVARVRLSASLPDGTPYVNDLLQHIQLRWGKVTAVRAMVDNVRAERACHQLATPGLTAPAQHPHQSDPSSPSREPSMPGRRNSRGRIDRYLVRRIVHRLYAALSNGDPTPMLNFFGKTFAYTFVGDGHALSGTRRTRAQMSLYLDRVLRLFPDIRFDVTDVLVSGPLWDIRVAVVATIRSRLQDGSAYENDLLQLLRLRWGRVVRARTFVDTGRLTNALGRLRDMGISEASMPGQSHRSPGVGMLSSIACTPAPIATHQDHRVSTAFAETRQNETAVHSARPGLLAEG